MLLEWWKIVHINREKILENSTAPEGSGLDFNICPNKNIYQLYLFSIIAITNYHKSSGFNHTHISSYGLRSEPYMNLLG